MLEHDLENTPLLIKTNTDTGLVSSEEIWIKLFDSTYVEIGEIIIYLRQNPLYHIRNCMKSYADISLTQFPSETNIVWSILKQPGPKLTVQGNNEMVIELLMSSSTCDVIGWESYWNKDVKKIMFSTDDRASNYFEFTAGAGNSYVYFNYNHLQYIL